MGHEYDVVQAEQELEKYRGQAKKQEEQQKHQLELIKKHEVCPLSSLL